MATLQEFFAETKEALIDKVLNREPNTTPAPGMAPPATSSGAQNLADLIYSGISDSKDKFVENVTRKFRESGFGQQVIAETKQQELQTYLKDPTTWTVIIAALAVLLFFGGVLGRVTR